MNIAQIKNSSYIIPNKHISHTNKSGDIPNKG